MDFNSNDVFYVQHTASSIARIRQSVSIPSSFENKYLLVIGYGWLKHELPGGVNHPYLWGTQRDDEGLIITYMTGGMTHDGAEEAWKTMCRIFQIQPGAATIMIQLSCSINALQPNDETLSIIDDVGLYVFDTQLEAENYRDVTYIPAHPEVFEAL